MDMTIPELPSAYKVALCGDGRYYPMRFGMFRLGSDGTRIHFDTPIEAATYCWQEQRDYERLYPAPSDRQNAARSSVPVSDLEDMDEDMDQLAIHLADSGDITPRTVGTSSVAYGDTPRDTATQPHRQPHLRAQIDAERVQRMLSCVCPSCAVVRSCYPNWQPPSLARLHRSDHELARIRGICSHPDCTLPIETYCSVCRAKLCRVHLGHQQLGADVVCSACRSPQPHDAA